MNIKYAAIVCMVMTFWFYGCSDQQDKFVVSIVIDDQCITENLTETEIVNTVREHFNFIQSYFTREFNIQLLQNNIRFISLTKEEGQDKSIIARPAGTDIFVVYMNNASHGGGGRTHLDAGNVFMYVSFEDKSVAQMNSYKWLLIHEIAHLFAFFDLIPFPLLKWNIL